jgi:hypothetical protein
LTRRENHCVERSDHPAHHPLRLAVGLAREPESARSTAFFAGITNQIPVARHGVPSLVYVTIANAIGQSTEITAIASQMALEIRHRGRESAFQNIQLESEGESTDAQRPYPPSFRATMTPITANMTGVAREKRIPDRAASPVGRRLR